MKPHLHAWIVVGLLAAALSACGSEGPSESTPAVKTPHAVTSRTFVHEREFTAAPALASRPTQVAVLDLEPSSTGEPVANILRYRLPEGLHRFCIDGKDPVLRRLVVEDASGTARASIDPSTGCTTIGLAEGTYTFRVFHDPSGIVGGHRVAFLRNGNVSVPIADTNRVPVPGWWAMQPLGDPQGRQGRVAAPPPAIALDTFHYPSVQPMVTDFSSQHFDSNALFIVNPTSGSLGSNPADGPRMFAASTPLNVTLAISPTIVVADNSGPELNNPLYNFLGNLFVADLGNSSGAIGLSVTAANSNAFGNDLSGRYTWDPNANGGATVRVLFRFFPDGKIDPPLRQGEVALYQGCNYQGKATVFALDAPSFTDLDSAVVTIDRTTASIRLGNDTAITLFSEAGFTGTSQLVKIDTPCLDGLSIGRGTRSIQIEPLTSTFNVSVDCPYCRLQGIEFELGLTLHGVDLTGADLTNATLPKTVLARPKSLIRTNFSGAKFFCVQIQGDPSAPLDLTQTIFTNVQWITDGSCRAAFTGVKLLRRTLDPTQWRYLDLSHSMITGLAGVPLSSAAKPLDLTGAILTGTDLTGAVLDSARGLAGTDLTGTIFSGGSLANVNLSNAKLANAHLDGVNAAGAVLTGVVLQQARVQGIVLDGATGLAGANLTGVQFNGAHFEGTNLAGAQLAGATFDQAKMMGATLDRATGIAGATWTGVDLTGASFAGAALAGALMQDATLDGVKGLVQADLTNALFSNSSLKNVDFTSATLQGTKFINANLENATLRSADLSPSGGAHPEPTDLSGAHLKNVDLSGATLNGTIFRSATFYGSFGGIAPTFPCQLLSSAAVNTCTGSGLSPTGTTCSCASARGAKIIGAHFENAFLFGVDFGGPDTKLGGVSFGNAILIAANFVGATSNLPPVTGVSDFSFAWLQGAQLTNINLAMTSLDGAFVDFGSPGNPQAGNIVSILLGPRYTAFKGWKKPNAPVCVATQYGSFTSIATAVPSMTCPNGSTQATGCGPLAGGSTSNWNNGAVLGQASPPGYYQFAPTFGVADQSQACNSFTADPDW